MLVLSRKQNQKVITTIPVSVMAAAVKRGEPLVIETQVVDIRGGKVRLGCTATKEIVIHREEVQQAIDRERPSKQVFRKAAAV